MIIGLTGAAGSGKDTVAAFVARNGLFKVYRMAQPLKNGLSVMFNIPLEDIEDPAKKNAPDYKFGRSIRYLAQTLGTQWGRMLVADDVWIQMAMENISKMSENGGVIIPDIRFNNEAHLIRQMGGKIIKIERPSNELTAAVNANGVSNHASEAGIIPELVDATILNDGNMEDLYAKAMIEIGPFIFDRKVPLSAQGVYGTNK